MTSPEGECVPFLTPIDPKNKNIEVWMVEVKDAMIGKPSNNHSIVLIYQPMIVYIVWLTSMFIF